MKVIFISGVPRSGTTLLADLLGAGLDSIVTPESQFLDKLLDNTDENGFIAVEAINHIKNDLSNDTSFKRWGCKANFNEKKLTSEIIESFINDYAEKNKINRSNPTWIDHTPSNLERWTKLKKIFPQSIFISILRDPRAIYASVKRLDWGPNNEFEFLGWWKSRISQHLLEFNNEEIIFVTYEDLILDPPAALKKLQSNSKIVFDLDIKKAVIGGGFRLPDYTKKQHQMVGKQIDKTNYNKWEKELALDEIHYLQNKLESYLLKFGYGIKKKYNSKKIVTYKTPNPFLTFAQRLKNKILKKIRNLL